VVLLSEYLQGPATARARAIAARRRSGNEMDQEYGDKDGDGFVEYQRVTERGLVNQGWKDSRDGVPQTDGPPRGAAIALVECRAIASTRAAGWRASIASSGAARRRLA